MSSNVHAFDRKLLARMTGALGDDRVIGRLALELGQVFGEFLPDICRAETGLDITIGYAGFRTGLRQELIAGLGTGVVISDVSLRNWCADFQIGCDSPIIITLVEALLGAVVLFKALTIETEDGDPIGKIAWKPLITIVASIAVFGVALPYLGMVISLPLLILMSSYAGDEFHWKDVLINSVVLTIGSYLIFILGLKLVIPVWPSFMG